MRSDLMHEGGGNASLAFVVAAGAEERVVHLCAQRRFDRTSAVRRCDSACGVFGYLCKTAGIARVDLVAQRRSLAESGRRAERGFCAADEVDGVDPHAAEAG